MPSDTNSSRPTNERNAARLELANQLERVAINTVANDAEVTIMVRAVAWLREGFPSEPAGMLEKVAQAYGYLWHVNNELGTPQQYDPEAAAYMARRILRDLLTSEQRGEGITAARHEMLDCKVPPAGWRCTREAGHAGPCAAINDSPETKCEHTMVEGRSTLHVIDPYKAKCKVCLDFFDLPLSETKDQK